MHAAIMAADMNVKAFVSDEHCRNEMGEQARWDYLIF